MLKQDASKKLLVNEDLKKLPASSVYDAEILVKSFCAGGIAGMVSKTTVAPLDRIKILLQGHNAVYKSFGVISGMIHVVRTEGFLGLYKGNGAMMVRVFPYAAVQFVTFDTYKKLLAPYFNKDSHHFKLLAGSSAGVSAVVATYPLDLVRARLAFIVDPKKPTDGSSATNTTKPVKKPGVASTLTSIFRNEGGFRGLYRGLTPSIAFVIPYAGLNFYTFERIKSIMLTKYPSLMGDVKGDQIVLTVSGKLIAGGIAGSVAQTFAYPLDVARRRMQLSFISEETKKFSKGIVSTLYITYRDYGIVGGLFRGMTANYIRAAPLIAVNFAAYETLKQLLGLKTGIDIKAG